MTFVERQIHYVRVNLRANISAHARYRHLDSACGMWCKSRFQKDIFIVSVFFESLDSIILEVHPMLSISQFLNSSLEFLWQFRLLSY